MSSVISPRRLPRLLAVLLCFGLLAAALSPAPAQAQDIDDLRSRAAALADELEDLEREAAIADEEYLGTLDRLEQLYTEINTTKEAIAEAQTRVDAVEGQVSTFLVAAYVDAGSTAALAAVATDDLNTSLNQQVLLDSLRGDREQLADELVASRGDLDDRNADLETQQADVKTVEAEQQAASERLDEAVGASQALYDQANGELQEALEAERQRREAEAARIAAAEAAAREAAQAEAAARQTVAAATAPAAPAAGPSRTASATPAAPSPAPSAPRGGSSAPAPQAPPPAPAPPTSGGAAGAIQAAKSQIGLMYRYGGTSPSTGFDCSGLMMWSWAQVGVGLPRTSRAQFAATQRISMSQIQPGDLVFYGSPVYHVGMYVGGGATIDSPRTGKPVAIRPVGWFGSVSGVGRVR